MLKLVDLLHNPTDLFDHRDHRAREPQRKATTSSVQDECASLYLDLESNYSKGVCRGCMLVAFLPIILPFSAGLSFVKWAYNIYSRTYVSPLSTLSPVFVWSSLVSAPTYSGNLWHTLSIWRLYWICCSLSRLAEIRKTSTSGLSKSPW